MSVQLFPFQFNRRPPPPPVIRGSAAFMPMSCSINNEHPMRVEFNSSFDLPEVRARWNDLVGRSAEPNGFLEPGFALSAAQHFLVGQRPALMRIESLHGVPRQLGLFAWEQKRGQFGALARAWCPPLTAQGSPLVDADFASDVFDTVRAWFARERPGVAGLIFPSLPADGPIARMLAASAAERGLAFRSFDRHQRAGLRPLTPGQPLDGASRRHVKELRRQRRRLADLGAVTYRCASEPHQVRDSVERFLALEASGWKGKAGTALLCDASLATFTRTMTRQLAHDGRCRVESLELDGRPIAMGIVLTSRDQAWLWKIAYDESLSSLSPGVQFVREFTERQAADPRVLLTDSCAIPDHPMIDRVWPERIEIADCAIAVSPGKVQAFERACGREDRRRKMRETAKRLYHATVRRRPAKAAPH